VLGILFKGIDQNYQRSFLKEHLKAGSIPTYDGTEASPDILLSDKICQQLGLKLNDEVSAFFVKNRPISRKLKLVGIYNTGFEEYDQQMAICDIRLAQQLNDWCISGQLEVGDSLVQGQLPVILTLQGKTENLSYDWGEGPSMYQGKLIPLNLKDTTLSVQLSKVNQDRLEYIDRFKIHIRYIKDSTVENSEFQKITTNISGKEYDFHCPINEHQLRIFKVSVISGNGTSNQFLSGYEIHLSDWYQLDKTLTELKQQIERIPNDRNEILKVVSIFDLEQDLFNWLAFLDINVVIIVSLMLLIGIINIGSALLVLIIIRSNFIGLMKAFGSSNGLLRKIFLVQAAYLIFRGLLFGNIIGLGIYLIQSNWGILTLNPDVYYLNKVPMELDFATVVLLNLGTFILCMISLLLPSSLIARVNPIKSIKFN
jgi:lipoprotein-releasing system permease protein